MIEAFRVLDERLGYSSGGCPPTFSWDEEKAKIWTRKGDLIRHLKLLGRKGLGDALERLVVERILVEPRAKNRASEFLREFDERRELAAQARQQRKITREKAGIARESLNQYVNRIKAEHAKDPIQTALDALLKTF